MENHILKKHFREVKNSRGRHQRDDAECQHFVESMRKIVGKGAAIEKTQKIVSTFSECYAGYSRRHLQELSYHLDQVKRIATPSEFAKFSLWMVALPNEGEQQENSTPGGGEQQANPLVATLQRELEVTEQHDKRIVAQQAKIRKIVSRLNELGG